MAHFKSIIFVILVLALGTSYPHPVQAQYNNDYPRSSDRFGQNSVRGLDTQPFSEPVIRKSLPPLQENLENGSNGAIPSFQGLGRSGLSASEFESLQRKLTLPVKSKILSDLLTGVISGAIQDSLQSSQADETNLERLELLLRTGQFRKILSMAHSNDTLMRSLLFRTHFAWALLAAGQHEKSCETAYNIPVQPNALPRKALSQTLLLNAYCAARNRDYRSAQLSLDLARDQGSQIGIPQTILDRLASGTKKRLGVPKQFRLIDYAFLRLTNWPPHPALFELADTGFIVAVVNDPDISAIIRLGAAEAAAKRHAMTPRELEEAYLRVGVSSIQKPDSVKFDRSNNVSGRVRAGLLHRIKNTNEPGQKAQLLAQFISSSRSPGLFPVAARIAAKEIERLPQSPAILRYSDPLIEALVTAGKYERAAQLIRFSNGGRNTFQSAASRWLVMLDIAQANNVVASGSGIRVAEDIALGGQMNPDLLHKLITVLDALEYHVPIPLWNLANEKPQPSRGFLPETGHLSRLTAAAKQNQTERTILMTISAIGPDDISRAHILVLSDTIRALKAVGLERQARQLAVAALVQDWQKIGIR